LRDIAGDDKDWKEITYGVLLFCCVNKVEYLFIVDKENLRKTSDTKLVGNKTLNNLILLSFSLFGNILVFIA
jgi:hypothetical protein